MKKSLRLSQLSRKWGKITKRSYPKGLYFISFCETKSFPRGDLYFSSNSFNKISFPSDKNFTMLFSFRMIFMPGLIAALFIPKQALSTPEPETMGNFAKAGKHQPPPPDNLNLPGPLEPLKANAKAASVEAKNNTTPKSSPPQPMKKQPNNQPPPAIEAKNNTALKSSPPQPMKKQPNNQPPPAKKAKNNTPPPPPSVPIEELSDAQPAPPPAPPVPQHNPQSQKKAASPSPKKRKKAPQASPFNSPDLSANRRPQNVPPPLVELEEPAEIFDYSSKVIIFYKPCKNQPSPCRRPLMTNSKDTMFKYDRNRNINISGIARKKPVKAAPQPDNMGNL